MSRCDLVIAVEREDQIYLPGETVHGAVSVMVNKDCRCDGLTITWGWRTHGSGNRTTGGTEEAVLFTGDWRAGEAHMHPFEFVVPHDAPMTYHGHHLNVDWFLNARADIPWAFDPKAEHEVLVVPGPPTEILDDSPVVPLSQTAAGRRGMAVVGVLGAGCLVIGLIGGVVTVVYALMSESVGGWVMGILPFALFGLVGLLMCWLAVRNTLAQRKLGPTTVEVGPAQARAGAVLSCKVSVAPPAPLSINGITAELTGKETVVSGSGTNTTTYTHELHQEALSLSGPCELPGPSAFDVQLFLPGDAPPSFYAPSNQLAWSVSVRIDVPSWPDWAESFKIEVMP